MTTELHCRFSFSAAGLALALAVTGALAHAQTPGAQDVPNMGQQITPLAPEGSRFDTLNPGLPDRPNWLASQAATSVVSPDKKTLLVLTSGFNRAYALGVPETPYPWSMSDSNEYVFIYDISTATPVKKQVVQIANSYYGIVFDPSGAAFYVAGGPSDNVHIFTRSAAGIWGETPGSALALGHNGLGIGLNLTPNNAVAINSQVGVRPCAAGVAISSDGKTLVVANYYNDSITVFTGGLGHWSKLSELDLRPGKSDPAKAGVPGGEYPFWVVVKGAGAAATAYVSSIRDREIVVVNLNAPPTVAARIPVKGQPNKMTLNAAQTLLYVAADQADTVDVIDTVTNTILESIPVVGNAPAMPARLARYKGANPNSVMLSPDEKQLYVTNGNLNCVSVVALDGPTGGHVVGFIPTGWYPNSVSFGGDGGSVYVINAKSPTGANPQWCYGGYGPPNSPNCLPSNQYNPQLTKAGLQSFPRPSLEQLANLTEQVVVNNRFRHTVSDADLAVMAAVRQGVKHVIFIIKENRTYDQILGDLEVGNGDPTLTEFGEAITPNHHRLARTFVTLDNFLDTAEVSYDGWSWSTSAQAPDVVEHQFPVAYAARGLSLDGGGMNRNVNVGLLPPARQLANPFTSSDPDVLPGNTDTAGPDGPNNQVNTGYLWNAALRAHLTVRNYGFSVDGTLYGTTASAIPVLRDPFASKTVVAYPSDPSLAPFTDPYFRGFDNSLPDHWRYKEWARDFDARYASGHHAGRSVGDLPALTLVRLMHDHTGNYSAAIDGVNTPDLQVADNDYAVALLVQKIANSPYANNTLIFIIEDDAQDGGDHVDSHRSTTYVVGAYVKRGAVVSTRYTTLDLLRTIEEVLGLPPMNLNDALARPMADIFNTTPSPWSFTAAPATILYNTSLPLPPLRAGVAVPKPVRDAAYWARVTQGMNFTTEDRLPPGQFNRILWEGMMGGKPYPATPTGIDLRLGREKLLADYRRSLKQTAAAAPKTGSE
jgi:YVTN family beta-propeller protein